MGLQGIPRFLFRRVVRWYPASFQRDYGDELESTFLSMARAEPSVWGVTRLLIKVIADGLRTAVREHRYERRLRGRGAGGDGVMTSLGIDVRYAWRAIGRQPGFTFFAVLTLGLGIGANTAIFSMVNGVLLRPLPYENGEDLVVLRQHADDLVTGFSVQEVFDYRAQAESLTDVVEYHSLWFSLIGRGDPERVLSGVVSWQFFDLMGVRPALGRSFVPQDDELGAPPVLLLSDEYWRRSFDADSGVVGQTVRMNDAVYTIVGVYLPCRNIHEKTMSICQRCRVRFVHRRRGLTIVRSAA